MSKEKSGKINSDEEYGSEDELIVHELAGLDLNSSESKSSPSPTLVRSTPRNTPVRANSTGSQTGSTSSKENTPSRASSRTSNVLLNPITSKDSMGSLGSAAMGSDDELKEQDDRFIEQNRWTQEQLQRNQNQRPSTSLGYTQADAFTNPQTTFDSALFTIGEVPSEGEKSEQSSAAPSRTASRNSFSNLLVSPRAINRKQIAPFQGEVLTETSQDSDIEIPSGSSGDRSPGRKNKRSLSSPEQGFVSLDTTSDDANKRRRGNYVKPVVPIPKSSVPEELQDQLYEVWDEEKEDYENYRLLKARQIREARRQLKKGKKKVEAAGAGSDSDSSDSYDEEIDAEYRYLINLFSGEFEAYVAVIKTGLYDPENVNAESFFNLMSFWLSLYYNINTDLRHRQVLINYLIELQTAIEGISTMATPSGRDNRQLIIFLHFLDDLLTETTKEQQDYMNNKRGQMRGGSKKRKTRKRTAFKKTSRKTAKRNVKSKPKRKASRKIKLTRKKKVATKKRKFIKTKRSLKTNKKIRTRKR